MSLGGCRAGLWPWETGGALPVLPGPPRALLTQVLTYLVIEMGIADGCGIPDLMEEVIADGILNVDTTVSGHPQNAPATEPGKEG